MSVIHSIEYKRAQKRANEIRVFLLELDSVCDTLYNRLEYNGVWETLMQLEDVRVKYYTEFYEHKKIITLKGTPNVK